MVKTFCDICGKEITVSRDKSFFVIVQKRNTPDYEGVCKNDVCDECANKCIKAVNSFKEHKRGRKPRVKKQEVLAPTDPDE